MVYRDDPKGSEIMINDVLSIITPAYNREQYLEGCGCFYE